ncbi:MAG: hypothetical protein QOJ58_5214, partial [Alphaproteobacteria bacterium]|nr:hypothetical protein [Alphaproteobacteria bacterium]
FAKADRKIIAITLWVFAAVLTTNAQGLLVGITVSSTAPARIRINVELPKPSDSISFPNAYAGVLGLAERIENVGVRTVDGQIIAASKLAPGEFQAPQKFDRISYNVDLSGPIGPSQGSHVSSLNSERGILMLADLLPRSIKGPGAFSSARIQIVPPAGWTAESNAQKQSSQIYLTDEPNKAVFLIAPRLERKVQRIGARDFSVVMSGDWEIADQDVLKVAGRIVQEYSKLTGFELKRDAVLMLVPFADNAPPSRWTAETRGNAVVLLLGSKGNSKQVKSRLGIALAHEVFHLWVPNSLDLAGDYDWFFEGFTIYQALRMDLRLHLISFNDYLDTIARVYDSYLSSPQRDNLSLIEASERRWTTSTSAVYDKAMLVAFLYDLQLRAGSGCKASLADLYRQLFQRVVTRQADANETIIGVLNAQAGQQSFARQYIESAGIINLESMLSPYGISVSRTSTGSKLSIVHADKAQKKVLNCLARD